MSLRRRRRKSGGEDPEVSMSSLIDCVFLLLIFFLATTMFKRKESMIPFTLPDDTSSLQVNIEENRMRLLIAKDRHDDQKLSYYRPSERVSGYGAVEWHFIGNESGDLSKYLETCIKEIPSCQASPLIIEADGDIEFQKAITALDVCKLMGFENVSIRTVPRKTVWDLKQP